MTDTNVFKLESWLGLSEQFFRFDKWNPCRRIEFTVGTRGAERSGWRSAPQPALNEEALVKLGSETLARLVIGEAKRNAAFRKLVPAALAAIIDKRLAGLDRAKGFVDWEKAKVFTADIAATLATITGELALADPDAAVDRLVRFLSTAGRVFERIDDSNGRLQNVYHEAAAALPDLVGRLEQADKASIPDRLFALTVSDDYGFFSTIMPEVVAHLPAHGDRARRW